MRDGLAQMIGHEPDLEVCGEATGEDDALDKLECSRPDLVIVDILLKQGNGIELIKRIKARKPALRMIVLSMHDESLYAERALRAGAMGYVNKQSPARSIIDAIRQVLDGRLYLSEEMTQRTMRRAMFAGTGPERTAMDGLSDRELEVFELIGQGLMTGQLAERLHLSPRTIETYRQRLKTKLNLNGAGELSREAVLWVLERRQTRPEGEDDVVD
jgi:DNA-binding NarL/FixJ family response regulator